VEIAGCDRQPCGGTHVTRTGQIGLLLLRGWEKSKQNWRVEFVAGERARRAARRDADLLARAAREVGCATAEIPAHLARLAGEQKQWRQEREKLLVELADREARLLLGEPADGQPMARVPVVRVYDGLDAAFLRRVATQLAAGGRSALLGLRSGGNVVFAQPAGGAADLSALLRECVSAAGGKGGGQRDFAQGSVPDAGKLETILEQAAARLAR